MNTDTLCKLGVYITACITALFTLVGAQAQELEEITITGSRLLTGETSVSPVLTIDAEDMFTHPSNSITEYLGLLSSNAAPDDQAQETADQGRQRNAGDRGTSVDLRGLGPQYTLVLVDGKRSIEYGAYNRQTGWRSVDLNATMPAIAIKNIQVLADGGSAIYGSDAVAGVVNLLPDYEFQGMKAQVRSSVFDEVTGSPDTVSSFMVGTGNDDTNIIFAFENRRSEEVNNFDSGSTVYYPDPTVNAAMFDSRRTNGLFNYSALNATGTGIASSMGAGTTLADPYCGNASALGVDPIEAGYLDAAAGRIGSRPPNRTDGPACQLFDDAITQFGQKNRE